MKKIVVVVVAILFLAFVGTALATEFGKIDFPEGRQVPVELGLPMTKWIDNVYLPTAGTPVSYTLPTDDKGARASGVAFSCTNPIFTRYAGTAPNVVTATASILDGSGAEYQPVLRINNLAITAVSILPTVSGTMCSVGVYKH
jgi:hypothetical protein